jgi:hypothetical protein
VGPRTVLSKLSDATLSEEPDVVAWPPMVFLGLVSLGRISFS